MPTSAFLIRTGVTFSVDPQTSRVTLHNLVAHDFPLGLIGHYGRFVVLSGPIGPGGAEAFCVASVIDAIPPLPHWYIIDQPIASSVDQVAADRIARRENAFDSILRQLADRPSPHEVVTTVAATHVPSVARALYDAILQCTEVGDQYARDLLNLFVPAARADRNVALTRHMAGHLGDKAAFLATRVVKSDFDRHVLRTLAKQLEPWI